MHISPHLLPENVARALLFRRQDRQARNPLFGYVETRLPRLPDWIWARLRQAADREQKGRTPVAVLYDRERDQAVVILRLEDWRRTVGYTHGP